MEKLQFILNGIISQILTFDLIPPFLFMFFKSVISILVKIN